MLTIAMAVMFQASEVRAAEPLPAEAVVVADAPVAASPAVVVNPVVVPPVEVEAKPAWWLNIVETVLNYFWEFLGSALFVWALKKAGDRKALADAIRALEGGVNEAWYSFVKDLKSKAESGGKLTKDEKTQARMLARQKAKEIASKSGKKVLMALGEAGLNAIIEKILRKNKAKVAG
jgi:hypothetical protein